MSYKWGHPVVTLPVTNGNIRYTRRMTEILRIKVSGPAIEMNFNLKLFLWPVSKKPAKKPASAFLR
eukprot:798200-Pleurochrysis_carterae.AAC.1